MGSNAKEVQQAQKERAEQELADRIATLSGRGLGDDALQKDRIVRSLKADIKSYKKRLATIEEQGETWRKAAEKKAARLAEPRQKKRKKKVAEPAPTPGGKKKKKNKVKK